MVFQYQDWQKTGRIRKSPGAARQCPQLAGMPLLIHCPEQGLAMESCLPPLLGRGRPSLGRSQTDDETPMAAADSCGSDLPQLR